MLSFWQCWLIIQHVYKYVVKIILSNLEFAEAKYCKREKWATKIKLLLKIQLGCMNCEITVTANFVSMKTSSCQKRPHNNLFCQSSLWSCWLHKRNMITETWTVFNIKTHYSSHCTETSSPLFIFIFSFWFNLEILYCWGNRKKKNHSHCLVVWSSLSPSITTYWNHLKQTNAFEKAGKIFIWFV